MNATFIKCMPARLYLIHFLGTTEFAGGILYSAYDVRIATLVADPQKEIVGNCGE